MYACLRTALSSEQQEQLLRHFEAEVRTEVRLVLQRLRASALPLGEASPEPAPTHPRRLEAVTGLARGGLVQFASADHEAALQLVPASPYFDLEADEPTLDAPVRLSRFFQLQLHEGQLQLRNPNALCYLVVRDSAVLPALAHFAAPAAPSGLRWPASLEAQAGTVLRMLLRAGIVLPCDAAGDSVEQRDPALRQWDAHDLAFHASSRFGRSDRPIGGTFRFKGELPPQPPVKPNPWRANSVPLPRPDLAALWWQDPPFTAVLESRRSNRAHSPVALTLDQLGAFLFRSVRNRYRYDSAYGEFVSRPYPNGGANYEQEFYLTINQCAGLRRGFYYYDPEAHALCLVHEPCDEMESLLTDAWHANAMQCRPQVLITIASRFARFNWKYAGMSYAAQLKNVGAIYQTMYLVATAMGLAACGLGTGNADRFCRLTGLDWAEESSIGEFMLGRAL